jgi:hypothetical protein
VSQPSPQHIQPPVPPAPATSPTQSALVKQIGKALIGLVPANWQQINAEFRAAGRYYELTTDVVDEHNVTTTLPTSHEVATTFARLRTVMHQELGGAWFTATYHIERPAAYNLEFDKGEPRWGNPPPLQALRDELQFYPRRDQDVPEWLIRKLSGLPAPAPTRRLRMARIFDGPGPNGRPQVNRPPIPDPMRPKLLEYLDRAPLVLPPRGKDLDRLAPEPKPIVPVAFHTDGVWIWPAAVNFYLRVHGVPPEQALVEHIRAAGFVVPEVDEAARAAAATQIVGPRPPEPLPTPPRHSGPVALPPLPPSTVLPELDPLRMKLRQLGVPESAYSIGQVAEGAWYVEQDEDGWNVGHHENDVSVPLLFDDPHDAAAFFLGKLVLKDVQFQAGPPPVPSPTPTPTPEAELPNTQPLPDAALGGPDGTDSFEVPTGPQLLPGEPPLDLFIQLHQVQLEPGTRIDRFGEPAGNLAFPLGTPYETRSLPEPWREAPYHAYEVVRSFTTFVGTAISWFDQPGGATAYILPVALDELVRAGELVELKSQ